MSILSLLSISVVPAYPVPDIWPWNYRQNDNVARHHHYRNHKDNNVNKFLLDLRHHKWLPGSRRRLDDHHDSPELHYRFGET